MRLRTARSLWAFFGVIVFHLGNEIAGQLFVEKAQDGVVADVDAAAAELIALHNTDQAAAVGVDQAAARSAMPRSLGGEGRVAGAKKQRGGANRDRPDHVVVADAL